MPPFKSGHGYEPIPFIGHQQRNWRVLAAFLIVAVIGALRFGSMGASNRSTLLWSATAPLPLAFRTFNVYTRSAPLVWFRDIEGAPAPPTHLAEPYRESTFVAQGGDDGARYLWRIGGVEYEGAKVTHTFETVGKEIVELRQGSNVHSDVVIVKYVRREIRALLEEDRSRFLDSLETLYRLSTSMGVQQYGAGYKGIEYFMQLHLDGAGVKDCDHWHDDAATMTHHAGYTLEMEQALQVIDPSVAIPYWEYTLDEKLYGGFPDDFARSPIFRDDWFGEMSPDNELHVVARGRWAFTPVAKDSWDHVHNSWGLLRVPWNVSPVPYFMRYKRQNGITGRSAVTCASFASCFASTTLAAINSCLNTDSHGPIHVMVGGAWNTVDEQWTQAQGWAGLQYVLPRALWRLGFLRFPNNCNAAAGQYLNGEAVAEDAADASSQHRRRFRLLASNAEGGGDYDYGNGASYLKPHGGLYNKQQRQRGRQRRQLTSVSETGCRSSCPMEILEANGLSPYDVLHDSRILLWIAGSSSGKIYFDSKANIYRVAGLEDDAVATGAYWARTLAAACDSGSTGELATAGAPYDPLFWPIHPAIERLLSARRLLGDIASAGAAPSAWKFTETWGYDANATRLAVPGSVCDWRAVKNFTDLPRCRQGSCGGHEETYLLPFRLRIDGREDTQLTNSEMLALLHPLNDSLPYVYDTYAWPHCADDSGTIFDVVAGGDGGQGGQILKETVE